jgi:16S rRNA (cytosine1402-N4)-methyltransferase
MQHIPVLLSETIALLSPALTDGWLIDCTVGLGGHSAALLEACPNVRLLAIDRDPQALAEAERRLAPYAARTKFFLGPFSSLTAAGRTLEGKIQGVLADLGVSSLQLDEAARGFSLKREGPLDMRMAAAAEDNGKTARDVVNEYPEEELAKIFREYGEETQARRIARAVVGARAEKPLETTLELARLVEKQKPERFRPRERKSRLHPATQVFQALRIEVNDELRELDSLLEQSIDLLDQNGRLVVISYHSLEDRVVKHTLRDLATGEIEPVTGRPRAETQVIEVLTRKPIRPSEPEIAANPRARSARLRAARRSP